MTDPTFRQAARWWYEPAPRPPMAHKPAFVDMAHEIEPQPESLALAVVVLVLGLPLIAVAVLVALWPGQ